MHGTTNGRRVLTRSQSGGLGRLVSGGEVRCVCGNQLVGLTDRLLRCLVCDNWSHPDCVAVSADALSRVRGQFTCPFCAGTSSKFIGRKRTRPSEQKPVELKEVVDVALPEASRRAYLDVLANTTESLRRDGYDVSVFPSTSHVDAAQPIDDEIVQQVLACCSSAIADLTFSESYPEYCINEVRQQGHRYLQSCVAVAAATSTSLPSAPSSTVPSKKGKGAPNATPTPGGARAGTTTRSSSASTLKTVASCVLSNGMDQYTSLLEAITHARGALADGSATSTGVTGAALEIEAIDDFVHFTLIVTADDHRGKRLAKRLLLLEMVRWCLRGRTRAFLNMALQKSVVHDKIVCTVSPAAKRLYAECGFLELCEVSDRNGNFVWSRSEEDLGRVMLNVDMPATVRRLALTKLSASGSTETSVPAKRRGRPKTS